LNFFQSTAVLLVLAAALSYINFRFLKLPTTVGLMALALALSLLLMGVGYFQPAVTQTAVAMLEGIEFNRTLLDGMLGFLLFAGALHININDISRQKWIIGLLASVGVLISTFIVGVLVWLLLPLLGLRLDLIICLLFGALIAPTDPIAVLAILKTLGAPKSLETKLAGESLFNDGVGVVVFLALLGVAELSPQAMPHVDDVSLSEEAVEVGELFVMEVFGGAAFGLIIGLVGYFLLKSIDEYKTEILISLAMVTGGYALATYWHLSGPIAMVVAGLLIGNHGRALAMSRKTRANLDTFWELVDEILNAVLFVLIGLEVLVLSLSGCYIIAGLLAIPVTLLARFTAVGLPVSVLRLRRPFTPHVVKVLTWSGLRGGISVAMALALRGLLRQQGDARAVASGDVILTMTYAVVAFSILAQGLTIAPLLRRLGLTDASTGP